MSRSSCWLLLLGLPVFVWLAPLLTPWQENPQIYQPAVAQAAWVYAWLALFTWLPFQAATLGHRLRVEGMLEHLRAGGANPLNLCLQLTTAVFVWMLAVGFIAFLVCVTICLPSSPDQKVLWIMLSSQYLALYLLTGIPLILLAVALGTRTAEIIAFLAPVVLLFTGLFGGSWLVPVLTVSEAGAVKSIWLILPHYHLADITQRLVFKMGPLPASDFLSSLGIIGLQGAALVLLGQCTFRTRS